MVTDVRTIFAEAGQRHSDAPALYAEGAMFTWGEMWAAAGALGATLAAAGLTERDPVGWVARNEPSAVAAAIGLLAGGFFLRPLNPHDPPSKRASSVLALAPMAVVDGLGAWQSETDEAVRSYGGLAVELSVRPPRARLRPGSERLGRGPFQRNDDGAVLERLSSGTTGEPKRIPVSPQLLRQSMSLAFGKAASRRQSEPLSPQILSMPLAHATGVWNLVTALYTGRPIILQDRFRPEGWIDAVRTHRVKAASLVPTMIRMLLDLDPPREALSSLICIRCGTAPLDPTVQREFEARFGIPILIDYGASEFMGGIAGWSLDEHRTFGESKRGSVGRLRPDVEVRLTDQETGAALSMGGVGVLWVRSPRFGAHWIETTDLASCDAEGFLYIHGRADEAIIRGGFKILPEKVAAILRTHPAVCDACVLGVIDERLGQVPLAVIERMPGAETTASDLAEFVSAHVAAYEVPVMFEIVDELPRTISHKVARATLRKQLSARYTF